MTSRSFDDEGQPHTLLVNKRFTRVRSVTSHVFGSVVRHEPYYDECSHTITYFCIGIGNSYCIPQEYVHALALNVIVIGCCGKRMSLEEKRLRQVDVEWYSR